MKANSNDKKSAPKIPSSCHDYRGLKCPLPVLKARRALSQLIVGQGAEFLADDPASPLDMRHFCSTEGHELCIFEQLDGYFRYYIIKKGGDKPTKKN